MEKEESIGKAITEHLSRDNALKAKKKAKLKRYLIPIAFFISWFIIGILLVQTIAIHNAWTSGLLVDSNLIEKIPLFVYAYISVIFGVFGIVQYSLICMIIESKKEAK